MAPRSRGPSGRARAASRCTRFRADIDYGLAEARTTYGVIGVKVWIFKGEVFDQARSRAVETTAKRPREPVVG